MSETIKGGAYQNADGTWHDAENTPLSDKQVREYQDLMAELEADEPEPIVVPEAVTVVTNEPPVIAPLPKRSRTKGGA